MLQDARSAKGAGLAWGFIGVLGFSFTVPATRVAIEGLTPLFVASSRSVLAGVLAAAVLVLTRAPFPRGGQWRRLALIGAGILLGFPLMTSYALVTIPAGQGAIITAVLPAATAVAIALRTRDQPGRRFWVAASLGVASVVVFALTQSGRVGHHQWADTLLLGAVLSAAVGYAEGGLLARELGTWQTVCWALVMYLPVTAFMTGAAVVDQTPAASASEWACMLYLGLVSTFLTYFAWYRGLSIGPMARVSQVQLVQPVFTLLCAAALLNEDITAATVVAGAAVVLCASAAVRASPSKQQVDASVRLPVSPPRET